MYPNEVFIQTSSYSIVETHLQLARFVRMIQLIIWHALYSEFIYQKGYVRPPPSGTVISVPTQLSLQIHFPLWIFYPLSSHRSTSPFFSENSLSTVSLLTFPSNPLSSLKPTFSYWDRFSCLGLLSLARTFFLVPAHFLSQPTFLSNGNRKLYFW